MNRSLSDPAHNNQRPIKRIPTIVLGVFVFTALIGFAIANSGPSASRDIVAPSKPVSVAGIQLPAVGGNQVALSDYVGHEPTLLYFSMGIG